MLGVPETAWSFMVKLIPAGTFALGIVVNRWLARWDKQRKDKKSTSDLLTEIELLEVPLHRQGLHITELVERLRDRNKGVTRFTSVPSLVLDRLVSLDRPGIKDHLERVLGSRKRAVSVSNRLFIGCDALTDKYKELHKCIEDYLNRTSALMEQWATAANKLQRSFAEMMSDNKRAEKELTDDPLLNEIAELTSGRNKTIENPFLEYEEVHEPLANVLARYWPDPRAEKLAYMNSEVYDIVAALERERVYCTTRLSSIRETMDRVYRELLDARNSLSNNVSKGTIA